MALPAAKDFPVLRSEFLLKLMHFPMTTVQRFKVQMCLIRSSSERRYLASVPRVWPTEIVFVNRNPFFCFFFKLQNRQKLLHVSWPMAIGLKKVGRPMAIWLKKVGRPIGDLTPKGGPAYGDTDHGGCNDSCMVSQPEQVRPLTPRFPGLGVGGAGLPHRLLSSHPCRK
jgi:hypothetical protein